MVNNIEEYNKDTILSEKFLVETWTHPLVFDKEITIIFHKDDKN